MRYPLTGNLSPNVRGEVLSVIAERQKPDQSGQENAVLCVSVLA